MDVSVLCTVQSEEPEYMLGQTYDLAGPEEYTHREVSSNTHTH